MLSRPTPRCCRISIAPAAARSGSKARRCMSATCARPSGTTIVDIADPRDAATCSRSIDVPEGWHSHKVRVAERHHDRQSREVRQGRPGRVRRRPRHLRRVASPATPKLITKWRTDRRRRAPLRFRRPLRLYLADGRRLCRQHRDDPRSRRSGEAGRGRPLVDSRASGRRAARNIRGTTGCRRAAIIRCASATGSMSATGITASSFSTSPTCRSRSWSRTSTPARRSRIRPTPACAMPQTLKGRDIMVVADEDVAKLWPAPPSFAWVYDITNETLPVPIATFQVPGLDIDGAPQPRDDRLPSAVRALSRHGHSVRLVRAGAAAGRFRRSVQRRRRSGISARAGAGRRARRRPTT